MKKNKNIILGVIVLSTILVVSGFTDRKTACSKTNKTLVNKVTQRQTINMFLTHGHCSTPFAGVVENLKLDLIERKDAGNPLEGMKISFDIDPNTFNVCRGEDLTKRIKTPGLFIGENNEKMKFRTTEVYTMGLDWYQINGKLSIKGVERSVKFFATGIRNPNDTKPSSIIIEGQLDLMDWGIDYDKIVNGRSDAVPTKWMHFNMRFAV